MLGKMIKIAACCILACSFSPEGNASDTGKEELLSGPGSPRSSSPQPLENDDSLTHQSSEKGPLSPISSSVTSLTEEGATSSVSPPKAGKRRAVSRNKSTGSKAKSSELKKKEDTKVEDTLPVSRSMQVQLAPGIAELFANNTHRVKPKVTPSTSENLFSPIELLPVHLLLALLANETKEKVQSTHHVVYIPGSSLFIGFKNIQYGTMEELKTALAFDQFKEMMNVKNALSLLCICVEKDLHKIKISEDMEKAEDLIGETQKEQWYKTKVKAIRMDTDKRPEKSTISIQFGVESESNLAAYALYSNGKLLEPKEKVAETQHKSKKDKKKASSKSDEPQRWIQVLLSVTKIKEQSSKKESSPTSTTPKRKKSEATTPRKRAASKGASAASSSASAVEEVLPITAAPLNENESIAQPSLTPTAPGE